MEPLKTFVTITVTTLLADMENPFRSRGERKENEKNEKRMVAMVLSLAMIMTSVPAYAAGDQSAAPVDTGLEKSPDFEEYLESKYVDPDRVYSSDVRWWLGQASNTDEVLLDEIQALYDGGFRGVELCMQTDTTAAEEDYAYGSEMWAHKWNLMMNKLLDLGMGVYLTSGTNWATSNVPASSLDPSSEAALQVLAISDVSKAMIVKAGRPSPALWSFRRHQRRIQS